MEDVRRVAPRKEAVMSEAVRELARANAQIEMDIDTTAKVVESLVLRGDISALSPAERSRYYVQMCESLGLNPAAQPFALLRLNGKEIMYPTRGATDQLAAIHRINREIIDGPKLIDLGGSKQVYAMCRATHPNGRTETSVATVPFTDPSNVLMKCETKAKRRATLSILGLGMLDEMELETIPAHAKAPSLQIEVPSPGKTLADPTAGVRVDWPARIEAAARQDKPGAALLAVGGELAAADLNGTRDAILAAYGATVEKLLRAQPDPSALEAAVRSFAEGTPVALRGPVADAIAAAAPGVTVEFPEVHPVLAAFQIDAEQIELPGEAVSVWIKHRAELAELPPADREAAWKALCKKTEQVGKMKSAKVWLKRAIAEDDARKSNTENNQFA
jgi:hypothetical protein